MKRAFLQWFEHKSRDINPQDLIEDNTAKTLEKMLSILSKSQDPKLVKEKETLNLVKKKVWKEINNQQQKAKEIQLIREEIRQKNKTPYKLVLKQQLKILNNPEPLAPIEMVDSLLSLPKHPRYKISSIKKVSERIDSLQKITKLDTEELIYTSSELATTALVTPIKYKIDLRKKFLEKTLDSLSIVTKLPNKPGDQENISGVVKNLQESFKGVFTHNQELYKKQVDLLAESLQLLLRIRGELKAWVDVDKFVKQYKIPGEQLIIMVRNAKSPDGSGIFKFFGGEDLNNLVKLLDKLEFLMQDHRLFYKTIIKPSEADNLILKLENYKKDLEQRITATNTYNLYYACLSSIIGFHFKNYSSSNINIILEYWGVNTITILQRKIHKEKLELPSIVKESEFYNNAFSLILSKYFDQDVYNIILEYLGINNIIITTTKHYKKQLEHTSLAIKWLTGIQLTGTTHVKKDFHDRAYINVNSVIELLDEKEISHGKARNKLKKGKYYDNGSQPLTKIQQPVEKEYLDNWAKHGLKEKQLLLKQTQEILGFFEEIFLKGNIQPFQKILQLLDLIDLDSHSSNFLKIIDLREKSNLEFIQKTIDPIIYLIRFFSLENMLILNTDDKLVLKEIEKIEEYLTNQTGPMLKTLIESAIYDESELLNNLSYLIKHESIKKLNAFKLLDLLIRLTEYGKVHTQNLLSSDGLDKLVMFKFTTQILFNDDDKFFLLFYLIDSGYANLEMVNELLKIEIDINASHNGRTLLDSIAYQLTKVGRETDFSERPKKYVIDPEKQDQLIDVALYLIHNKADINSGSHTRGFLTTLFSIIPSEQSPYLYKKLLSDQEIISQLDLQEVDFRERNIAHLFCRDLLEIFYSFPDAQVAKKQIGGILTKIISSKNSQHFNNQDREGNTPWHYLASSITADYVKLKTDGSFSQFTRGFNLSIKNIYGDTPLHIAFTQKAHPAAFYEFVLTDIYSPSQWLESPRLGLKIKNNQKQTVLDLIVKSKSNFIASVINTYMAVVNYKINLDDGSTFETIRSKVDTYLKGIPQVPADEIEQTIYLAKSYDSTQYVSSSSSSSLSSSSTSSMSSSSSYYVTQLDSEIIERGRTDTVYDWHTTSPLTGESDDFTLHG